MKRQLFTRSLRINFSCKQVGSYSVTSCSALAPLELSISPQLHYSFRPSLYHCITGPHTTHTRSPHHTLSLAAQHTLFLAATSAPPPRLRSLASLDNRHCLCLSKPQLCTVEGVRKRFAGSSAARGCRLVTIYCSSIANT